MSITHLFLDLGGVMLTNGWDTGARKRAADTFHLDFAEMEQRHRLTFDTYEVGKVSLPEYLNRVVFYAPRPYSQQDFIRFMFEQSQPHDDMIGMVTSLKVKYGLKVAVLSNEGRELSEYRIQKFELTKFVDFFIFSAFVHLRKPDVEIYRLTLDIAQAAPAQVAYLEDRPMFAEVAAALGLRSIRHESFQATTAALKELGLAV